MAFVNARAEAIFRVLERARLESIESAPDALAIFFPFRLGS